VRRCIAAAAARARIGQRRGGPKQSRKRLNSSRGIAVRTDHSVEEEVKALFTQVTSESGKVDILVNDIWGGDDITQWRPF
jgi:NAD(P)-dependent dehydrogenase (short-subunit alcohol dehydrogenase family)